MTLLQMIEKLKFDRDSLYRESADYKLRADVIDSVLIKLSLVDELQPKQDWKADAIMAREG